MKKVSLLLSALVLVGGVSFAGVKEKKDKKAKTESCSKEGKGSCCAKKSGATAEAKDAKKSDLKDKKVSQDYKVERSSETLTTR